VRPASVVVQKLATHRGGGRGIPAPPVRQRMQRGSGSRLPIVRHQVTVSEFILKWMSVNLDNWKERATFQTYFNDLCSLVGHAPPVLADPDGETFKYEKFVIKPTGKKGFADVVYKGHFAWEQKGRGEDLDEAFAQLLGYIHALGNPPLLVVGDFETIIIHTNFNNTEYTKYVITLEELSEKLELVAHLFHEPENLRPPVVESELGKRSRYLSISCEQTQPVRVESGVGRYGYPGGPLPAISGETEYRIVLTNPSYITARLITVDLSIDAELSNRPDMRRHLYLTGGWHIEGSEEQYYRFPRHYRFQGSQDDYCLPNGDDITIGYLSFQIQTTGESQEIDTLILRTEAELENSRQKSVSEFTTLESVLNTGTRRGEAFRLNLKLEALKGRGVGGLLTDHADIQRDLLTLYHREPAKDLYRLCYKARAEDFSTHEATSQIEIVWSNRLKRV